MTPNSQSRIQDHANEQALLHADENALEHGQSSVEEAKDESDLGPTVCDTAGTCYPNDSNETGG